MRLRNRCNIHSLLLTSTALLTIAALPSATYASSPGEVLVIAQAPAPAGNEDDKDKKKPQPPASRPPSKPQPPAAPPQARPQPPAAPPQAQTPAPPQTPAAQTPKAGERRPAPAAQEQPRRDERRPGQPPAPAAQNAPPAGSQERQEDRRPPAPTSTPTARQPRTPNGPAAPATAQERPQPSPGSAQQQPPQPGGAPSAQQPPQRNAPATAQQPPQRGAPATAQQPAQPPAGPSAAPATAAPPTQARDSREFLRRDGQKSERGMSQLRQERHEVREGNRTVIREGDRTIIREGDRTIIRHNEANRFAVDARNVRTERRGAELVTIIERPNGIRIINITDADGRLIRRLRRDESGREIIIIDNSFAGQRPPTVYVELPPPVIRIPRGRYILEAERARPGEIYEVFMEPPVERIEHRYTLDQVRFSAPLRERMARVDLDVNFDTGSWQLTSEQVERLAAIADGINRAIRRNPQEVFLVEGHTDAIGDDVDNLSLSDRRAEAVAVALTEQFRVPAENLVTQGYGERYLKVPTEGPERANRRVAVRRITPLIDQQAQNLPPPR